MNVTLILGNGFDLNMGLPTSYSDFYQYYLEADSPIKGVDFIKDRIKNEPKTWADLEKALGDITAEYSDKVSEFDAVFSNVRNELEYYLKAIDEYDIPKFDIWASRFLCDVLEVDRYLDNKPKREYREFVRSLSANNVVLNVVNFNYTSTIEKIKSANSSLSFEQKKIQFGNIVHVHQDLNAGIIMGVNDKSQIANEAFRKSFDIQSMMIKPFINEEFAAGNDEKCVEMINASDIIILFGSSFGDTDRKWWDVIARSVNDRGQRVIYCPYEVEAMRPLHETDIIRKVRYFKDSLAKMLVPDLPTMQQNIMAKIYPVRNNHMFNFGFTQKDRDRVRSEVVSQILPFTLG